MLQRYSFTQLSLIGLWGGGDIRGGIRGQWIYWVSDIRKGKLPCIAELNKAKAFLCRAEQSQAFRL